MFSLKRKLALAAAPGAALLMFGGVVGASAYTGSSTTPAGTVTSQAPDKTETPGAAEANSPAEAPETAGADTGPNVDFQSQADQTGDAEGQN